MFGQAFVFPSLQVLDVYLNSLERTNRVQPAKETFNGFATPSPTNASEKSRCFPETWFACGCITGFEVKTLSVSKAKAFLQISHFVSSLLDLRLVHPSP